MYDGSECRVGVRTLAEDEPRHVVPILLGDSGTPVMSSIASLGCYKGRQENYVPGADAGGVR